MPQKNILLLFSKLVLDSRMFGKGIGFPNVAEAPSQRARDFCAMMYYNYHQGKSFQQSFHSLSNCFRDQSLSRFTVHNWCNEFQSGRTTFEDSDRCGHPVTSIIYPVLYQKRPDLKQNWKCTKDTRTLPPVQIQYIVN